MSIHTTGTKKASLPDDYIHMHVYIHVIHVEIHVHVNLLQQARWARSCSPNNPSFYTNPNQSLLNRILE